MKTAVEWQFEQFFNSFEKFNNGECTFNDFLKRNLEIRKQAKEMEKEQIEKSFSDGAQWELYGSDLTHEKRAKKYYNETFKQQEQ
jgi:hypothetical protein